MKQVFNKYSLPVEEDGKRKLVEQVDNFGEGSFDQVKARHSGWLEGDKIIDVELDVIIAGKCDENFNVRRWSKRAYIRNNSVKPGIMPIRIYEN